MRIRLGLVVTTIVALGLITATPAGGTVVAAATGSSTTAVTTHSDDVAAMSPGDGSATVTPAAAGAVATGPADLVVTYDPAGAVSRIKSSLSAGSTPARRVSAAALAARAFAAVKSSALADAGRGVAVRRNFDHLPVQVVRVDSAAALADLAAAPGVLSIDAPRVFTPDSVSSNLTLINQPQAVNAGYTGSGSTVAVLDTGVDWTLPGVDGAFGTCSGGAGSSGCRIATYTSTASTNGCSDDAARDVDLTGHHGTNVSGVVAAVAPAAKLDVYKVFHFSNCFTGGLGANDADVLTALSDVVSTAGSHNIKAVNLSLGENGTYYSSECGDSAYAASFATLRALGVVPVVAAGNSAYPLPGTFRTGVSDPACAPDAVRVGAVYSQSMSGTFPGLNSYWNGTCQDQDPKANTISCFSQTGPLLSVLAPGLYVTAAGVTESGTSQAAPHVAGAIADLASAAPSATVDQVVRAVTGTGPLVTDARDGTVVHRLDIAAAAAAVQVPLAEVTDASCLTHKVPAAAGGSSAAVPLPFTATFFGASYTSVFVNNDGNVTFGRALTGNVALTLAASTPPIIAPFLSAVDTRSGSQVTYGSTTYAGRPALCVDWNNVGYDTRHTDKVNSFQLLLVDRSDIRVGDFDVQFNYNALNWESGDSAGGSQGLGGVAPAAGISAGDHDPAHYLALPGSLTSLGLIDYRGSGLTSTSRGTLQPGRYLIPIRSGALPGTGSVGGRLTDVTGAAVSGAPVQACPSAGGSCVLGATNAAGVYSVAGLAAGSYLLTFSPPAAATVPQAGAGPVTVTVGGRTTANAVLGRAVAPPSGTTITDHGTTSAGVPIVDPHDPLVLQTTGCVNATASYTVTGRVGPLGSGALPQTAAGSGVYRTTIPALTGASGSAVVQMVVKCAGGSVSVRSFSLEIDPSGTVVDTSGRPLSGATVTLLRSDTAIGPFTPVTTTSAVASPGTRQNPVTTGTDGAFRWGLVEGFYKLTASRSGCVAPGSGAAEATSAVFESPPFPDGLALALDCTGNTAVGRFGTLAPARILDTRRRVGVSSTTPVAGGGTVTVAVAGRGGVPLTGVSAVVLNLTVTQPSAHGYITAYPAGSARPSASSLNFVAGQTVPNVVVVPLSADGRVTLFNGSGGTVHLVADVAGYYLAGAPVESGTFGALTPTRILDTRVGNGAPPTAVASGGVVTLTVAGRGGVPASGVGAVVLNVTVTGTTGHGYVTVYPSDSALPVASSVNFVAGQTVPNLVVVPLSADGNVSFYNGSPGSVQLIADVAGYYLAGSPTVPGSFAAVDPARILDTRSSVPLAAGATLTLTVGGQGGLPASGVVTAALNVTVTDPAASGFLTLYPDGTNRPTASNVNFTRGQTIANAAVVAVAANGKVDIANNSAGTVQVVVDVAGYWIG